MRLLVLPIAIFATTPVLGAGLCTSGEETHFSCAAGYRHISLCGVGERDSKNGYLQYRFGTPDKIELEYPPRRAQAWKQFRFSGEGYAGGEITRIAFEVGSYRYVVYDAVIKNGPPDEIELSHFVPHSIYAGVAVLDMRPEAKVVLRTIQCDSGGVLGKIPSTSTEFHLFGLPEDFFSQLTPIK